MRENGLDMFLVPFNSLADSLQRLIFYKAAIESNTGKVICFEEPEAHTFPPYISNVVNDIISSDSNQFFITTHSPYVMSSLLESAGDDFIILVHPAVDGFILSCAEAGQVDLAEYNLSPVLKEFTAQAKNVMSNKDTRFKRQFKAMKDVGEMKLLESFLTYLVSTTYNADNNKLISFPANWNLGRCRNLDR